MLREIMIALPAAALALGVMPAMAGSAKDVLKAYSDIAQAGYEDSLETAKTMERATGVLQDEREPIAAAVKDPEQRAKLEALRVALKSARETASELITAGAGLSFGFNAADGD